MAQDLWRIRRRKQMTIEELARQAGIHPSLIKAYELGQRPIPQEDLAKLAQALMVEPWDIKELSDPPPRGPSRYSSQPRYGGDPGRSRYERDLRPRYDDGMRSRYNKDMRPRYDSDIRPRYSNDRGRSRYGDERPDYRSRRPSRPPYGSRDSRGRRGPSRRRGRRRRQPAGPARPTHIEHLKMLMLRLDMSGDVLLRLAGKPLSMLNRKEAAHLLTTCQNMVAEQKPPRPKGKRQRPYLPESVDEHELVYLTEIQLSKRDMYLTLFDGNRIEGKLLGFSPYALTLTPSDGQEITVQKLAVAYYQVEPAPEAEEQDEETEKEVVA